MLETLPKPINESGKMPPMSFGGTFTLERVLGTVPVEPDGSAYMESTSPADLFFVALDADNNSVQRMMSFLTVMPGETASSPLPRAADTGPGQGPRRHARPSAAARARSSRSPGVPNVLDYPRDIQPILDRNCVRCHDYGRRGTAG